MQVDGDELILSALDKLEEPASLVALKAAVAARLPRVDLPELLLEMHARTGFATGSPMPARAAHAPGTSPPASVRCCWPKPATPASSR